MVWRRPIEANPMILACAAGDLSDARARIARGETRATELMAASLARADALHGQGAYIRRFDDLAMACADAVDRLHAAGAPLPPLAGLAVSVKDLFDVAGQPTTAGSRVLAGALPAPTDAPAVARLRAAGAALSGHTGMTEFAFSGVGLNPHHGTPPNPATAALDPQPRIPGGSTSGGAVTVAAGAAWAALGSDTGGSLRIPAALQGLVGFKPTQCRVPLDGAVPLSPTLDSVGAITRSVRDAALLHAVLAGTPRVDDAGSAPARRSSPPRLALPEAVMLDGLEPVVAAAFDDALARLRAAGWKIDALPLAELHELAALNAQGGFAAPEAYAWHRGHLSRQGDLYDPRVASRIRRGAGVLAADYLALVAARRDWIARVETALAPYDALVAPTVPMVAPPIADLAADDARFFEVNARLLRNPSVINFLDGCAISLPCHRSGGWPVGLMLAAPRQHDDSLLALALAAERALASPSPPPGVA
jgi:aspartyl-tRNA(Asn)/glutamyl-tRNA(Gln) amidotransferase subunit A